MIHFVDVLCLMQEVPAVPSGLRYESRDAKLEAHIDALGQDLEPVLIDLESRRRPAAPVAAKCRLGLPPSAGVWVAHIPTDETLGITQVGRVEWMPLGALLATCWPSATAVGK